MNDIPAFEQLFSLPDLWQLLAVEKRDILLYGMGNGADKILCAAKKKGVTVKGVFASDGFVRGQVFHDMPVRSFSEVCAMYPAGECIVLLAFGTARPEVITLIKNVAKRYPLYVPDVPVCGNTLFDTAFLQAHRKKLTAARACFIDENSRRIFDLVLAYKLTGRFDLLCAAIDDNDTDRRILSLDNVRRMADLGAYNGDTAREMLSHAPLDFLLAVEPDKRNFKKLTTWAKTLTNCHTVCENAAVYSSAGHAAFDASGNRNAGLCTGRADDKNAVKTVTVDTLLTNEAVDYIKYDVEGAEKEALLGSVNTIKHLAPRLKIACYHRTEDIFELPLQLRDIAPRYALYLTRTFSLPAWDLDILAVPE